jgi:DNA-binding XRE family transcriptional regulator
VNYGIPNDIPSPIIVPQDNKKDLLARGLLLPARPAWLCIDSPEHCRSGISEKDTPDLTAEQIAEAEAEDLRRQVATQLRKDIEREKHIASTEERKKMECKTRGELSKMRQYERRNNEARQRFAGLIRGIKKKHDWRCLDVANALGCSLQSIVNWETGRHSPGKKIQAKILALK